MTKRERFATLAMRIVDNARGGTSYDGLYGEAPREKGIFFSLQVCDRGVARIFQRGGHRGYSPDYIWFIPLLSLVYQRAQSYYCGMKAHIN